MDDADAPSNILPKNEALREKLAGQTVRLRFTINPKTPLNRSRRYWRYLPEVPAEAQDLMRLAGQGVLRTWKGGHVQPRTVACRHGDAILGELYLDVLKAQKLAQRRAPAQREYPPAELWVTVTALWPEDL